MKFAEIRICSDILQPFKMILLSSRKIVCRAFISLIFLCLLIVSGNAQVVEDDDAPITVDTSNVILNATVTDAKGIPAANLKSEQFRIFEDGAEQQIESFTARETPFAAVILIDTSGSMEKSVLFARAAIINFLDNLRYDDQVAIKNFDSTISTVQDFSNSRDVPDKIFDLRASGATLLNDAIFEAAGTLEKRPEKRRAIIVLSDGADVGSRYSTDSALKAALNADATIYTVDMSAIDDVNGTQRMQSQRVLKTFAEKSGGIFVPTPGGAELRAALKNIVEELSNQYTLAYQPSNTKKDGKWREIEVKVSRPGLTVRTRKGYHAPKAK